MIHISPCGWYSFEISQPDLTVEDNHEKTLISPEDNSFQIELLSARKTTQAVDDEISQIHEDYISHEKIIPNRTVLAENDFGVKFYVTQGSGMDEHTWIVCHAFWNNYCIFIQYHGIKNRNTHNGIQLFYNIVNGLQPLIFT